MASVWTTLGNVYSVVRSIANKDSTTLPDATLLPFANKYYFLMIRELIGLNEDLYAEICSANLVANQREYVLPIDNTATSPYGGGAIKIQRVEVSYDGSTWKVVEPIPFSDITTPTILDADIEKHYSKSFPKYYFKDRSVWLVPTPSSADSVGADNANLRIFVIERPGEMTSSASIPELPKDWLAMLQEGILYEVFRKFNRTTDARDALNNWNVGIFKMKELEQNIDEEKPLIMKTIYKNYK